MRAAAKLPLPALTLALTVFAMLTPATAAGVTLTPGDILVVDRNSTDTFGAVIRVDPVTGRQSLVSNNTISGPDLFSQPQDIALTAIGRIFVTDRNTNAVIEVDPATGEQSLISDNTISAPDLFDDPHRLAITAAGRTLVTDEDSQDGFGAVIEVDPATGQQTAVSNNTISGPDLFGAPDGIAVTQAGRVLVADRDSTDTFGGVIEVDPATGRQSLVSNNTISGPDLFEQPNGIALTAAGRILVADISSQDTFGAVIEVDPATGEQTALSNNTISGPDLFKNPSGLRLTAAGRILVADNTSDGFGGVIEVDPATGEQTAVSNNTISGPDLFDMPGGLLVVPPKCFGRFATIVGDPGRNFLRGTRFADVITGVGGNDTIKGFAGTDRICGGKGRDTLLGGKGRDRIDGEQGRDILRGGPGRDRLRGGPGRDRAIQ